MNDSVRMLDVPRDPTADDSGQADQVIAGTEQSYPGWMNEPGVLWRNSTTGELFLRVPPGPPVLVPVVPITPADFDEDGHLVPQNGHMWKNTATGSMFIYQGGEWLRCISAVPSGPYEKI